MIRDFHSDLNGNLSFEIKVENKSINPPASKNRIVNKNKGSAERNPNLPAVEAEAHRKANSAPMKTFLSNEGTKAGLGKQSNSSILNCESEFYK